MTTTPNGAYQAYNRRPMPALGVSPGTDVRAVWKKLKEILDWFAQELLLIQGAIRLPLTKTILASYTATPSDDLILVDCTAGAVTVTLPTASRAQDCRLTIKKIDATANAVTLSGVVDGTTNPNWNTQWEVRTVQSNGTQYYLISNG